MEPLQSALKFFPRRTCGILKTDIQHEEGPAGELTMATIYVDNKPLEVDGADNLLRACLSLDRMFRIFCWHPALVWAPAACAVKQYANADDKRGRLVMSRMTQSTDNHISIDDAEAKAFRKSVLEWLMTNHPHDCPVCEEGGHSPFTDMTVMTGP
jgi:NADH-quinone oxidoreductase subunit G